MITVVWGSHFGFINGGCYGWLEALLKELCDTVSFPELAVP